MSEGNNITKTRNLGCGREALDYFFCQLFVNFSMTRHRSKIISIAVDVVIATVPQQFGSKPRKFFD
jgi:hypothetical protein